MSHVFFSYSRKNTGTVSKIVERLRGSGFVLWQDITDIPGGANWQMAIQAGLEQAVSVIVAWSEQAAASEWVREEIQLALAKHKTIVPVQLDTTPLSDDLTLYNAIPMFDFDSGIERLIAALPPELRRERLGFQMEAKLGDHPSATQMPGSDLVAVPLLRSSYCRAAVVGLPETPVGKPAEIHLCLQFSQPRDGSFVLDVYNTYLTEKNDERPPFVALLITGPENASAMYRLNDRNPAHWIDAVDTTYEAVIELSRGGKPLLKYFTLGPQILAFAVGMKFYRFWHVQLYNFSGGVGADRYTRVMEILPG